MEDEKTLDAKASRIFKTFNSLSSLDNHVILLKWLLQVAIQRTNLKATVKSTRLISPEICFSEPELKMKSTATAGANIAFIKFWGVQEDSEAYGLHLPLNDSISMTLDTAKTTTTIDFSLDYEKDSIIIDGQPASIAAFKRAIDHVERLRRLAGSRLKCKLVSKNTFPMGTGIASSASGFAALTVAACSALELELTPRELSSWARLGSGSATRSIFGGYVRWRVATTHHESYAEQILPEDKWRLADLVAIVSTKHKKVTSKEGHLLAKSSPLLSGRLASLHESIGRTQTAIVERDFPSLGETMEQDALIMHSVMMTSFPPLLYWNGVSIDIMHKIHELRLQEDLQCYFTLDAGPNVHIITLPEEAEAVKQRLQEEIDGIKQIIVGYTGKGAELQSEHLF
ncbi:MAG: diphosphomevalonate decarboxylase [Candidatus Hodarchaeota archaeon]